MPIDTTETTEPDIDRRIVRLGLGVSIAFVVGVGLAWPISFIGAIFTNLLLQAPGPVPIRGIGVLLARASVAMAAVWFGAQFLLAYPMFFLVGLTVAIFAVFRYAAKGGQMLLVVLLMIAILLIPSLLVTSPELAGTAAFWLVANIAVAIFISRLLFSLIPPDVGAPPAKPKKPAVSQAEATSRAIRMTLVTAPYAVAHFFFGWDAVLTLIFIALLATALSGAASAAVGRMLLIANVAGGFVAITAYEFLVIAPNFVFMAVLVLTLVLYFARTLMSGGPYAPYAGTALNALLVLLGGAMVPFGGEVDDNFVGRLLDIGLAVLYIAIAFNLMESGKETGSTVKAAG